MKAKNVKIWIWVHNGRVMKAISRPEDGTLVIYDDHDCLLIKRTGLTRAQLRRIEVAFALAGAKRIDEQREPFTVFD